MGRQRNEMFLHAFGMQGQRWVTRSELEEMYPVSDTPKTDALIERQERMNFLVNPKDGAALAALVGNHFRELEDHAKTLERQLARYKRLEALLRNEADASQEPGEGWSMNDAMRFLTDWERGE